MNKPTCIWPLQEAKAKFVKIIGKAQTEGPQTVTRRGKAVAVITALMVPPNVDDKRRGADLVEALQACPYPDFFDEIDRVRAEERGFYNHVTELLAKDEQQKQSRARASQVSP